MRMKINVNMPCLSALLAAALLIGGCASQQYMGVSLKPGGADPAVQALAARASIGDKRAQLQLGEKFEYGDGVNADVEIALQLYKLAARRSKVIQVYQPGIGSTVYSAIVTQRNVDSQVQELARLKISNLAPSPHCEASC